MSSDQIDLRWLKSPRREDPDGGEGAMLRQAIRTLLVLDRSHGDGSMSTALVNDASSVAELAIEETTPLDRPTLVLAAMPKPAVRGRKSTDILLHCAGIRLLLSNPLAFVVFVTALSRTLLDEELQRWFSHSPHYELAIRSPYRHLATSRLVGWAFLTIDELAGCQDRLRERREQLDHLARSVSTDASGLRSLLHLLAGEGAIPAIFRDRLVPRFALVVDDEAETAARLSALVRRWGYSVLTIDRPSAWRWVHSGSLDLEHHFDLAVVDNVLGFEGAPLPEGHDWLRGLEIRNKIFKTAARKISKTAVRAQNPNRGHEIHIGPQIADCFQLRLACRSVESEWEPQGVLFSAESVSDPADIHSELRGLVIGLGHRLVTSARRIEGWAPRLAALHRLEAFSLVERLDGPLAAGAYSQLQEFEIEILCERAPGSLDRALLEQRLEAIRQGIERCFDSEDRTHDDSGRENDDPIEGMPSDAGSSEPPDARRVVRRTDDGLRIDAGLWISRTFTHLETTLRRYPISARLHQVLEIERREQRLRNQQLSNPGAAPWTSWILTFWNGLSRHMISLQRVAAGWLVVVLVFGIFYSWREAACLGVPLDSVVWIRGLGASLSCGLGFLYPHVYNFAIPAAELYCLEFVQRSLAVVLLARAVELVIGWLRYGS